MPFLPAVSVRRTPANYVSRSFMTARCLCEKTSPANAIAGVLGAWLRQDSSFSGVQVFVIGCFGDWLGLAVTDTEGRCFNQAEAPIAADQNRNQTAAVSNISPIRVLVSPFLLFSVARFRQACGYGLGAQIGVAGSMRSWSPVQTLRQRASGYRYWTQMPKAAARPISLLKTRAARCRS